MDKKRHTALVLLDLSKAFDSIDHLKLLHKLSMVGASPAGSGQLVQEIFIWPLSVYPNSLYPIWPSADYTWSTIPQGAILSPLLFCIYLNDLPFASQTCCLESYVDDSKVFLSFPLSDIDSGVWKLEDDLRNVARWWCDKTLITTYSLTRTRPNSVLSEPGSW